ncbi:MAG: LCP family protein [Oscillospiraceae bacterium]|nr:LCP family protein [Oscillospiraceae bacterium]
MRRRYRKHETTSRTEKIVRILAIFLAVGAFLMVSAYGFAIWFVDPPTVSRPTEPPSRIKADASVAGQEFYSDMEPEALLVPQSQEERIYTFLVAGEDDGFGGPDVIMVVVFNATEGSLDVLSIPRDTMVNVPWGLRKINSIQHMHRYLPRQYDHYIYALAEHVENIIGFPIDHWVTVDLPGFVTLIDALPGGGVEFNVPQRMLYHDPHQDLMIDLQPGLQHLNGRQAMYLVRFRNYIEGDIRRVQVQHEFLNALSDQVLQARNILMVDDLVRVFRDNVDTSLTVRNLAYLALEFLQVESENIRFHSVDGTVANIFDNINGVSYVSLYVEPWLAMINEYLNPLPWDIRAEDLEILTRDPSTGALFTTNGAPF